MTCKGTTKSLLLCVFITNKLRNDGTVLKTKSFTLHLPVSPSCYLSPGIKYKSRSQNLLRKIPRDPPNQTRSACISKVNKCFSSHSKKTSRENGRVRPRGETRCRRERGTGRQAGRRTCPSPEGRKSQLTSPSWLPDHRQAGDLPWHLQKHAYGPRGKAVKIPRWGWEEPPTKLVFISSTNLFMSFFKLSIYFQS